MISFTILGSGDTLGTPIAGCNCTTCLDAESKRYRFGILLTVNDSKILVDPNPDLKWQCIDNNLQLKDIDHVLVTHQHSDHINGLGEFFYRRPQATSLWYGKHPLNEKLIDYWRYLEREEVLEFKTYENYTPFMLADNVQVTPIELNHGFPACGFIVSDGMNRVAIVTDTNADLPEKTIQALDGVDVLFCDTFSEDYEQVAKVYKDCNIETPDLTNEWFHMTVDEVMELQKKCGAKKAYTVHMSRHMSPHSQLVQKYQTDTFIIGKDGLSGIVE